MNPFLGPLAIIYVTLLIAGSYFYGFPDPVTTIVTDPDLGFWAGLFHGIISPISFIVSLFNDTATVYSSSNSGGWYNFGYLSGVGMSSAGGITIQK